MKTKALFGIACGLLALLAGGAWVRGTGQSAQPPTAQSNYQATTPADQDRPADRAAVQAATQQFARAFEKEDAAAVAAMFTESGEYLNDEAPPIRGRTALTKAYADFFAKRVALKLESKANAVRFVGRTRPSKKAPSARRPRTNRRECVGIARCSCARKASGLWPCSRNGVTTRPSRRT